MKNLKIGDWVKYKVNYSGKIKDWDALVVDDNPLTVSINFDDNYRDAFEIGIAQLKHISLIGESNEKNI
jgi:hypothetical protein